MPAGLVADAAAGRDFFRLEGDSANEQFVAALNAAGTFDPRDAVETDESRRQVIPYALLRAPDGGYFTYRRLGGGGEARLFDRHSIGVGGHINDEHLLPGLAWTSSALRPNLIADGLQRELAEELFLGAANGSGTACFAARLHGFLALNETPVDRVHVGVVIIVDIAGERVSGCDVRERDKLERVGWWNAATLAERLETVTFEGWSRALIAGGLP